MSRASAVGFLMGTAWLAVHAFAPLESPEPQEAASPIKLPEMPSWDADVARRQSALERLGAGNLFAVGRAPWVGAVAKSSDAPSPEGDAPPVAAAPPGLPLEAAQLPQDLKQALDALELKGVYRTRAGESVAMISLMSEPAPQVSRVLKTGGRFTDPKHGAAEWIVREIEPDRDAVVLERGGVAARLHMYRADLLRPPPAAIEERVDGLIIERRSADSTAAELRRAGVPEEIIREVLAKAGAASAAVPGAPLPTTATAPAKPPTRDLSEMMRSVGERSKEPPKPAP